MTHKKHIQEFHDESAKLMDKYDLRITRLFWFTMGFISSAAISSLILFY